MTRSLSSRFDEPDAALDQLAAKLSLVEIESAQFPQVGRILAAAVVADRDSPAADVSAMDGYAIRMSDLDRADSIPVSGQSTPGSAPPAPVEGCVLRVFTGAIVPDAFDAVVKREDTEEGADIVRLLDTAMSIKRGEHIRRAGENARAGSQVLSAGIAITPAVRATMANFGCRHADLFAPVRVGIVTTGNEVGEFIDQIPKPWELRNSNLVSVAALLEPSPWIRIVRTDHCRDDRDSLMRLLESSLPDCDAIVMTGGVSMGDYDYVPDVIGELADEVVFHGLPIRPGKPILGAVSRDGKLLMGLPGNPVSATVGCQRMAIPLLRKMAGLESWRPIRALVRLRNADEKTIPLHWMRLARLVEDGVAELVDSLGSGDLVSLGRSSGFVELPPGASGEGPWPYVPWT